MAVLLFLYSPSVILKRIGFAIWQYELFQEYLLHCSGLQKGGRRKF